ncbi:MAG: hypothetical protein ROO71_10795 [Balneola sp.]
MRKILFTLVSASLLFFSCSNTSVDSFSDEKLRILAKEPQITLTNKSEKTIYYIIIESKTANRIDLDPDYRKWPSIEARSELFIKYDKIMGYEESSERAWIYWSDGEYGDSYLMKL